MSENPMQKKIKIAAILLVLVFAGLIGGAYMLNSLPAQDHRHLQEKLLSVLQTNAEKPIRETVAKQAFEQFFPAGTGIVNLEQFFVDVGGSCLTTNAGENSDSQAKVPTRQCYYKQATADGQPLMENVVYVTAMLDYRKKKITELIVEIKAVAE